MRKTIVPYLLSLSLVASVAFQSPPAGAAQSSHEDNKVLVQLADGTWDIRELSGPNRTLSVLRANDPEIVAIAPTKTYEQHVSSTPSDPAFSQQWHLHRIQAQRSWQHGDGSGVVVAVIDSGLDVVSDLGCKTFTAPKNYQPEGSSNGIPPDTNGHGTFVTQIVGECTDNGSYGAGVAPGTTIMPIRIIDSSGQTDTNKLYQALIWALDHGADIVNLSLGLSCDAPYPECNEASVDYALDQLAAAGVTVVASSGNASSPYVSYPANHPTVIAVGASAYDGGVAAYSDRGSGLHLVAPTGDQFDPSGKQGIIHQGETGSLDIAMGTSFSAPQVVGALASLMSAGASRSQAINAVLATAADISPSGYDTTTGYGELRLRDALAWGGAGLTPPIETASLHFAGDATGDDADDAITYDGTYGRWWVLGAQGNSFSADEWTRYSTVSGWSAHSTGDFTGDGRLDLASFHPSNGSWWVSRSTGSSYSTGLWADFSTSKGWGPQLIGDFNGDGRDDIANYHGSNGTWWVSRSTGSSFSTSLWADFSTAKGWKLHMVGDFNGDGRDDIASYHPSNGTWWVSHSTGSGFTTRLWADFSTASGWSAHRVGDFNGDGRDDIANFHPSNGTWWISRSTGSSFSTSLWTDFSTPSGWSPQLVGDFNGDGRDDIANYAKSNGTWWISRSTGSSFSTSLWADYSTATGYTAQLVGDFNGDGRDDIANHHEKGVWIVSRSSGSSFSTATWFD